MDHVEIDLRAIERGTVTAPAGCGKTQLIAHALARHRGNKPILVLTPTNAGVAALRVRLDRAGVPASAYRLSTIDGWAIRLISTFPGRSAPRSGDSAAGCTGAGLPSNSRRRLEAVASRARQ